MSAQTKSRFEVIEMTNGGECAIIALTDEDHTLANALRYVIVKNSNVQFCGYSLPHPNDNVVLLQIQMKSGLNAINALEKGFRDLMDSCQHIKHVFNKSYKDFCHKSNSWDKSPLDGHHFHSCFQ